MKFVASCKRDEWLRVERIKIQIIYVLVSLLTVNSGCSSGGSANLPQSVNTRSQNTPAVSLTGTNTQAVGVTGTDDPNTFINSRGWEIPDLSLFTKGSEDKHEVEVSKGRKLTINFTNYHSSEVVTEEPFKTISEAPNSSYKALGPMLIHTIREYRSGHKVFGYRLQVSRVAVDENRRIVGRSGSLFFFTYYDDDGDGTFETVMFDERSPEGFIAFVLPPHIPKWVAKLQ